MFIQKYFQEGLFVDPRTEKDSRRAMCLSICVAVLLLVQTVIAVINTRVAAEAVNKNPVALYITVIVSQVLVCGIPYCGYVGAKNIDAEKLFAACLCSSLCVLSAIFSAVSTLIRFDGYDNASCSSLSDFGLEEYVALCYTNTGINVALTLLFALCAYYTNQLYKQTEVVSFGLPDVTTAEV